MSLNRPRSICVFAGSSNTVDQIYRDAAAELGRTLASRDVTVVYGGGRVGLMGILADSVMQSGGRVIGVIPRFLEELEVGHRDVDELILTDSMHERKRAMYDRADGFISLPGGLGTLDETFEAITWTQLKLARKPIVLLNTEGYWDPLVTLIEQCDRTGFAREAHTLYNVATTPAEAVDTVLAAPRLEPGIDSARL